MKTMLTILASVVFAAPALAATVGMEMVLPASPQSAHWPSVAYGDGKYLVVWHSGVSGLGEGSHIYACRLDETGRVLDPRPFVVCKAPQWQERPRVAWGKGSWLVVWGDLRNGKDYDVYGARVSADGKVLDLDGILIATGEHNQVRPDVAFNGDKFLVVWRAFEKKYVGAGARVSADGKVLDPQPLKGLARPSWRTVVADLRVTAGAGGNWLAAWLTDSAPENFPGSWRSLFVSTVGADGKVTATNLAAKAYEDPNGHNVMTPITVASNGKDAGLLSWGNWTRNHATNGMPYGAVMMGLDGKKLATTELGQKYLYADWPATAWDGTGYVLATMSAKEPIPGSDRYRVVNRLWAHLVAADGKYEGKVEVVPAGAPHPPYHTVACSDGKGQTLIVYERHPADNDPPAAPIVIAARMVKR